MKAHPERQLTLELCPRSDEHEVPARLRPLAKLGEQPRLADAGRPDQLHRLRRSAVQTRQSILQGAQLGAATYVAHMRITDIEGARVVFAIRSEQSG